MLVVMLHALGSTHFAFAADNSTPDELGAKAFLEDILVRRYSQALSTLVDRQAFSLGAQLQLVDAPKEKPKDGPKSAENEEPDDLLLGTLDPDQLLKQYSLPDEKAAIVSLLARKRVKTVSVFVGLKEEIGKEVKAEVEKWLETRLNTEFGKSGKGQVNFVKTLPEKPEKPEKKPETPPAKQWWDWLNQFQTLVGQVFMAMIALLAIILWRFTTSKGDLKTSNSSDSPSIKLTAEGLGANPANAAKAKAAGGAGQVADSEEPESFERKIQVRQEVHGLSAKINALAPKLNNQFESIVRSWCQAGDEGFLKLVCFAEAVGKDLGGLNIPVDAMKDVGEVFGKMTSISSKEKIQALEKVYWDLVTVMNLGADSLNQPFGYLSKSNPGTISQILMDQNPKMKTLVALHLPDDVRRNFIKPLTVAQKMELLESAAQLHEVSTDELKSLDNSMKSKMSKGDSLNLVSLDMSLEKVASALSLREEIELLGELKSPGIMEFKRSYPSLAFLPEWPDSELKKLVVRMNSDQAILYLSLKPGMKDRIIALSPPFLSELILEELSRKREINKNDEENILTSLSEVMKELAFIKEVNLQEIFAGTNTSDLEVENVVQLKSS
jgi:hypothetical protein